MREVERLEQAVKEMAGRYPKVFEPQKDEDRINQALITIRRVLNNTGSNFLDLIPGELRLGSSDWHVCREGTWRRAATWQIVLIRWYPNRDRAWLLELLTATVRKMQPKG